MKNSKSFGKNQKKVKKRLNSSLKFGNFFFKKKNFEEYLTSYFGLMKKYEVNKKSYNFEKKKILKFFLGFSTKKMHFFYTKKTAEISNENFFFFSENNTLESFSNHT